MSLFAHGALAHPLITASSSCIGTGCPGTGSSHTVDYVVGAVLIVVAIALVVVAQRRDRHNRILATEEQAASLGVTLVRAAALLAALIGVLTLIFRP